MGHEIITNEESSCSDYRNRRDTGPSIPASIPRKSGGGVRHTGAGRADLGVSVTARLGARYAGRVMMIRRFSSAGMVVRTADPALVGVAQRST
ncbi:hypothetical protein [Actinophytocola algeriensis]|uniref:Uncharacterized protein n=1 Tax=Actinophytocola algeriensis TaxID=1768010 RepID=A0A7W7VEA3_9PSEU|nr:hypothetical protein [Actinophytocola algeriensis]MBB4907048.1 hypothetical protein [Actinophytocola algeriensis]MBE1478531.1 hypothetical protein [Actinophytocola algeriensis]